MRLELQLNHSDPPAGELSNADGTTIPFMGRLELLAALESFTSTSGTTGASTASDPTSRQQTTS